MTILVVVIVARLALGTAYSLLQPPLESHDETGHSAYVAYIASHLALPRPGGALTPYFDEGHQPPLYYVVPGLIGHLIGATGTYEPPMNPFFLSGDGSRGVNAAVHVPAVEAPPWRDGLLLLHLARFWSVILGGVTVLLTFIAGRIALPTRSAVALAGAGIAAFVPTSLAVTDAVTNDALVPVTFGVALIAALLLVQRPTIRRAVWFGVAIGASLLTKNSALILLPFAALILLVAWWPQRSFRSLAGWGVTLYGVAGAVSGWWYVRNRLLFGHWITDRAEGSALINAPGFQSTAVLHSASGSFVSQLFTYSFRSFWVLMGWGTLVAPDHVFDALLLASLACLAGLVWLAFRATRRRSLAPLVHGRSLPPWLGAAILAAFFLAMIPEPLYRAIYYESPALVPGRYLFGALGAAGLLLALGSSAFIARRVAFLAAPPLGLAALAIWLLPNVVVPAYAAPPPLPPGAAIPNRVDVAFGAMHLVGYQISPASVEPGGSVHVTLYWQALRPMTVAYTIGVHIVDAKGALLGGIDGYPGRGNLGTPIWQVGATYADPYDVPILKSAAAPQLGRVVVGVEQQVLAPTPGNPTNLRPIPIPATDSAGRAVTPFLGTFRVGFPTSPVLRAASYRLDGDIGVLHAAVAATADGWQLQLQLQALRPSLPNLIFFAHVLAPDGRLLAAGADQPPLAGRYPTTLWPAGEIVDDTLTIHRPAGKVPADAQVEFGAYVSGQSAVRLPVLAANGMAASNERILLPLPSGT